MKYHWKTLTYLPMSSLKLSRATIEHLDEKFTWGGCEHSMVSAEVLLRELEGRPEFRTAEKKLRAIVDEWVLTVYISMGE